MIRPQWDQIWLEFSHSIARRSCDPRFQVGSVVVTSDNTQVLAVGYNGDHKGGPNCVESPVPGNSGFIHAEINALLKMDYNNPKKKIMYTTLSPCSLCAKAIINAGISKIVYDEPYRNLSGIALLKEAGLEVVKFSL